MRKTKNIRIVLYLLLAFWMMLIFYLSSQKAEQSSQLSGGIVYKLITVFFNKFEVLSLENQEKIVYMLTFLVRKTAHFFEYFILGLLSTLIVLTYNFNFKIKFVFSWVFCVLYAISDEIHQRFVEGRACRLTDVCIDVTGSLLAIALMFLITHFIKKYKLGEFCEKKEIN